MEGHRFYRVRVLGEFPKSESDSLISIDELTLVILVQKTEDYTIL